MSISDCNTGREYRKAKWNCWNPDFLGLWYIHFLATCIFNLKPRSLGVVCKRVSYFHSVSCCIFLKAFKKGKYLSFGHRVSVLKQITEMILRICVASAVRVCLEAPQNGPFDFWWIWRTSCQFKHSRADPALIKLSLSWAWTLLQCRFSDNENWSFDLMINLWLWYGQTLMPSSFFIRT